MSEATRPETVGGYIRLQSLGPDAAMPALETIAIDYIGDGEKVAVALADAAANVGDIHRAAHWFKVARHNRPALPLGAEINELATALALATDGADHSMLLRIVARLEQLLESTSEVEAPSVRRVLLTNLGAAYRASGRFRDAATAWDEALAYDCEQRDLWIHRCMLGEQDAGVQARHQFSCIGRLHHPTSLSQGPIGA